MKKILYYLQHFDGFWSVPLGFLAFFFVGLLLSATFGLAVGQYDLAFIQPLFLAGTVVVGATNMAVLGLFFTFKTIYKYLYGFKYLDGYVNHSKEDFYSLTPIQRLCVSLFTFTYFLSLIIIVYLNLV